jgi:diguanylate cyclase (GGDEF)-like protein
VRRSEIFAVLFLDLDGFKGVNDNFGHDVGDALLKEVAVRLAKQVRAEDTVARLGGDEFVVAIRHIRDDADATRVAQKIIESVAQTYHLEGHEIRISTSVGISVYKSQAATAESLVKEADDALYAAKRAGKNRYAFEKDPREEALTPA